MASRNLTSYQFDDQVQRQALAIAFIVISFLGLAGNSLVLISMALCRKLRNLNNIFVANLSIADLATCSLQPVNAVVLWSPITDLPPITDRFCTISTAVNFMCVAVSVNIHASISVVRLLVVLRPLHTHHPRWVVRLWVLFTWLAPSGLILLPALILPGGIVLGYNTKYGVCTQKSSHPNIAVYNGIIFLTFSFPLVLVLICYTSIFIKHRRDSNRMIRTSGNDTMGSNSNISVSSGIISISKSIQQTANIKMKNTLMNRLRKRQIQITKNMLCVVCVFVVCISPYAVVAQKAVSGDIVVRLVPYCGAFVYFNSAVNPFIYARHPNFRLVFRLILTCRWGDIPEPSMTLKYIWKRRT